MANPDDYPPLGWRVTCLDGIAVEPSVSYAEELNKSVETLAAADANIAQAIADLLTVREECVAYEKAYESYEKTLELQQNLLKSFWKLRQILVPKHLTDAEVKTFVHMQLRKLFHFPASSAGKS